MSSTSYASPQLDFPPSARTGEKGARAWAIALKYALLISLLVVFVGPFLWLVSIACRGSGSIYSFEIIPKDPTFQNFIDTWKIFGLARPFINSVITTTAAVFLNLLLSSLAAYPLARLEFPGRKVIFVLILSTLMIPFQLYMIPLLLLCMDLHLFDTLTGVVLPGCVGAFGIFLIKQHYHSIPRDLEEAARIDGAGEFGIWWRIMLPLTKPAVAALAIFVFVGSWSNFLWPLVNLQDESKYTLPIAIAKLSGAFVDKTQYIAAGSVIAVLPVIVFFFFLQKHFIGGLTLGAVKG